MADIVWSWGANSCGQLGLGMKNEQVEIPQKVNTSFLHDSDEEIVEIRGGGSHTLLLAKCATTTKGNAAISSVYATGSNAKGQLGICSSRSPTLESFTKVAIDLPQDGVQAVKVSCGWDFSYIVLSDGSVLASGSNAFGQLGLGQDVTKTDSFVRVSSLSDHFVISVECGMRHGLFVTRDGDVLSTGCGKKGQLGLGTEVKRVWTPRVLDLDLEDKELTDGVCCLRAHCGQSFSLMECEIGKRRFLVGCGDNKFQQLKDDSVQNFFLPIQIMTTTVGSDFRCGWTHVIQFCESGMKSWGRNTYGQLGRSSSEDSQIVPFSKEKTGRIVQVSSGYEHVLAVTDEGVLYVWGWNEHGNCGLNGVENVLMPQELVLENDVKISSCFAGSGHSFCISSTKDYS